MLAEIERLRLALQACPGDAGTHYDLGRALHATGQLDAALASFDACLAADPDHAPAHNARGIMLSGLGRTEEASTSFQRAVTLDPGYANAHNNLGNEHFFVGHYETALASYQQAVALQPAYANAHNGLGGTLLVQERFADALASFDRAIALDACHAEAWNGRGHALVELRRPGAALAAYDRAIALKGDLEAGQLARRGQALQMLGRHREAMTCFRRNAEQQPDNPTSMSMFLFALNYLDDMSADEVYAWHRRFGERFESPLKPCWRSHDNLPDPERRLRIGFVSADLRRHSVGTFMEDVFGNLAVDNDLELVAYANQHKDDAVTERLRPHFVLWRNIYGLSDETVAEQVRTDGIDILVDLSGHTRGNRLLVFARKPAPVQASYLGYYASTGLTAMDYFIGDRWQMPEDEPSQFTETRFRTPGHHLCFTPPGQAVAAGPLPALDNGHVTFANFSNLAKMSDATVACWSAILQALPDSRLLLKAGEFDHEEGRAAALARFGRHGIGAERLILEGKSSFEAYLDCYQRVDIALDPFPLVGGTVTMQSLWMGVPVLTLYGDRHCSRNGAGIMHELDLSEWVAHSQADYVERALALSADLPALAKLRAGLRERLLASPLCDGPRFASELAGCFRTMWQTWCAQRHPSITRPA
jgi:predicted O-linked N-acetylglucosamine transferase (SPINDLY family)